MLQKNLTEILNVLITSILNASFDDLAWKNIHQLCSSSKQSAAEISSQIAEQLARELKKRKLTTQKNTTSPKNTQLSPHVDQTPSILLTKEQFAVCCNYLLKMIRIEGASLGDSWYSLILDHLDTIDTELQNQLCELCSLLSFKDKEFRKLLIQYYIVHNKKQQPGGVYRFFKNILFIIFVVDLDKFHFFQEIIQNCFLMKCVNY